MLHLSITYFIWCTARYTLRWTHVPWEVTRCTKLWGTQLSPELALRSTDFCTPENLIFPALTHVSFLKKVNKDIWKRNCSNFLYKPHKTQRKLLIIFPVILICISFIMQWLIHSFLKEICFEKKLQICPSNACKLDWEQNFFYFYIALISIRIKILVKVTLI